jgi:putative FmdB family regulatory protein
MPLFEYDCKGCGARFEALVRSAEDRPRCPKCNGKRLEKRFSTFAAATKGSAPEAPPACGQGACSACTLE